MACSRKQFYGRCRLETHATTNNRSVCFPSRAHMTRTGCMPHARLRRDRRPRPKKWKQLLDAYDLLLWLMATIVYDDIKRWHLSAKFTPEQAVGLVANENLDGVVFISARVRFDVDAVDERLRTKILAPHL